MTPVIATNVVATSAVSSVEIPLEKRGGTFIAPPSINDQQSLDFHLDSGSADVIGAETYLMVHGTIRKSTIFPIRPLNVGSVVLQNVRGSLPAQTDPPLLGMSFLAVFPRRLSTMAEVFCY